MFWYRSLFIPVSNMVQMDGLEVIEVRAVLKSPPVRRLRLLVLWISEPSVFDGLEVSLFYCNCFVFRFPNIVQPLFWSMTFSWLTFFYDVWWIWYDANSILDLFCLFRRGHETCCTWALDCSFFGILQARWALSCSECFAESVQSNVAHFFDWTPQCFAERIGCTFLFQIVDDGIGAISILQLVKLMSDIFVIRSSSL